MLTANNFFFSFQNGHFNILFCFFVICPSVIVSFLLLLPCLCVRLSRGATIVSCNFNKSAGVDYSHATWPCSVKAAVFFFFLFLFDFIFSALSRGVGTLSHTRGETERYTRQGHIIRLDARQSAFFVSEARVNATRN